MRRLFFVLSLALVELISVSLFLAVATSPVHSKILFYDDFSSGLGQWTGKSEGAHSGIIVSDPLASGHGGVLTFTSVNANGDIYTSGSFSSSGSIIINFDYLGLQRSGSVSGDLGGFLGTSPGFGGVGWLAGTSGLYSSIFQLVDDGQWHSVALNLDGPVSAFHLVMEDWFNSYGIAGDAYFDNINIQIVPVPEPATMLLLSAGLVGMAAFRRKFKK